MLLFFVPGLFAEQRVRVKFRTERLQILRLLPEPDE